MAQYYISAGLFAAFIICVAGRAGMLRKKGINAIVFGATDKTDFLLVPFALATIYAVFANTFALPLWRPLLAPLWKMETPGVLGLMISGLAVAGIIASLVSFGDSFRVGIDERKPDKLVKTGMFAFSRNPIYVCFDIFFTGLFLVHRNVTIAVAAVAFAALIHRQILREETFLRSHYGAEYDDYCRKVRRYL